MPRATIHQLPARSGQPRTEPDPRPSAAIIDDLERRLRDDAPVHLVIDPPTFGERLVLFFQMNGETLSRWFALASIAVLLGAVAGAYTGVGR